MQQKYKHKAIASGTVGTQRSVCIKRISGQVWGLLCNPTLQQVPTDFFFSSPISMANDQHTITVMPGFTQNA